MYRTTTFKQVRHARSIFLSLVLNYPPGQGGDYLALVPLELYSGYLSKHNLLVDRDFTVITSLVDNMAQLQFDWTWFDQQNALMFKLSQ